MGITNETDVIEAFFQTGNRDAYRKRSAISFRMSRNIGESGGKTCGKWDESHG